MFTRRTLIATSGLAAAAASTVLVRPGIARAAAPFTQPKLPYAVTALVPTISAKTVDLHYGKHHAGYYTQLNQLVAGTPFAEMTLEQVVVQAAKPESQKIFNQAGQAWNHNLYWEQMMPGGARTPKGALAQMIERHFGGLDKLRGAFVEGASGVFGSGWFWLVRDGDKLSLMGTSNADNPLAQGKTALLGIDVWEHAYYLDYQNRRADHVKEVLEKLINWDVVARRLST